MKRFISHSLRALSVLLALALVIGAGAPVFAADGFRYRHDPRLNPGAMADIVADETAIYGFRPSETGSLALYADADWSDPELVAQGRADRIAYHESLESMYSMLEEMRAAGRSIEEIARAMSAQRNVLRFAAYDGDPEGLAAVKARNLEKYGHEEGPLPDELFEKYGSWEMVLSKAFSGNSGMDACLGLYDDYYELCLATGQVAPEEQTPAERQYAVAAFVDALAPTADAAAAQLTDFPDAQDVNASYLAEWELAVRCGLLRGYEDHTLRPLGILTYAEALVLLSRCLPAPEAVGEPVAFTDVPDWAKDDIDRLSAAGLVLAYGDGTLGASDALTVAQVSLLLERVQG